MAKSVKINGVTYNDVERVELPLASDPSQIAVFPDTDDATATAEEILSGKTAYNKGHKIVGTKVFEELDDVINEQEAKINELLDVLDNKGAENLDSILAAQEAKIQELLAILDRKNKQ
jgi:hypothetical protein